VKNTQTAGQAVCNTGITNKVEQRSTQSRKILDAKPHGIRNICLAEVVKHDSQKKFQKANKAIWAYYVKKTHLLPTPKNVFRIAMEKLCEMATLKLDLLLNRNRILNPSQPNEFKVLNWTTVLRKNKPPRTQELYFCNIWLREKQGKANEANAHQRNEIRSNVVWLEIQPYIRNFIK